MAKKNVSRRDDIEEVISTTGFRQPDSRLDEAVCDPDVVVREYEPDEEDETIEPQPLIDPPTLTVVAENVGSDGDDDWVNLTVAYEAIPGYEYEFEIIEADI